MNCPIESVKTIKIVDKFIGPGHPVFIIAEAGVNHFGQLDRAIRLANMAAEAGADALKIQVFNTDYMISEESPEWKARMEPKELKPVQIEALFEHCKKLGIIFLASAHDPYSLDLLVSLGIPALKIGSGELGNTPYFEKAAGLGLPVFLSTGMYNLQEVKETLSIFLKAGNSNVVLLHCISLYPTFPDEVNLKAMNTLKKEFGLPVGYSDHTEGYEIVLAAVARGAMVIEKHIALEKRYPGTWDPIVSCTEENLRHMITCIRNIEKSIGDGIKEPTARELETKKWATKSIVARTDIPQGTLLTRELLEFKRPGTGIPPKDIQQILNRRTKKEIKKDTIILRSWLE